MLIGGVAVVVLAGAFFAYRKFTAEPPPPPPRPKPVAKPAPPPVETVATSPTVVDKPKETATTPVKEVPPGDSAATVKPVETPAVAVAPVAPPVVVPPPPPPPSIQFKAWVENLKIGGLSVRAGKPTRMTIGKTTYDIGDQVNPQLGITFEAFNVETKVLTFRDKSGAKVERRP